MCLLRTILTNLQPSVGETQQAGLVATMCWLRSGRSVFRAGSVRPVTGFPVRPDGVFKLVPAKNGAQGSILRSGSMRQRVFFGGWVICGRGRHRARKSRCERMCGWEQAHQMATNYTWQSFPTIGSNLRSMQRPHRRRTFVLGAGGAQHLGQNRVHEKLVQASCHIGVEHRQHASSVLEGV